jgi:hypothetical protein
MPSRFDFLRAASCVAAITLAFGHAHADECAGCKGVPTVVVGGNPITGELTGCHLEAGLESACIFTSYNTNFFAFTPPESGAYRISICTGELGPEWTLLSVRDGCGLTGSALACAVFGCPDGQASGARLDGLELIGGLTYFIGIGSSSSGGFIESGVLDIVAVDPPGAGCRSATVATVGSNPFDTSERTETIDLAGECNPWPQGGGLDDRIYSVQYFDFTPPASAVYNISTCGGDFTARLAVLTDCLGVGTVVACSEFGCAAEVGAQIIGVELQEGVEYKVLVGGYLPEASGDGILSITPLSPCPLPKPTVLENEPCGVGLNGDCADEAGSLQVFGLGDTVRGTIWADGGSFDRDWYLLDLAEGTEITLELRSDIPVAVQIANPGCSFELLPPTAISLASACPGVPVTVCLPAGRHPITVAPLSPFGLPCGYDAGNSYSFTVTGKPCDATPPPNDRCADAVEATLGSTPFDNFFADTEVIDPSDCGPLNRDIWFTFTAAEGGNHRISVCGGSPVGQGGLEDGGIEIWTDCPADGGVVVDCGTDGFLCPTNSRNPAVLVSLAAGQTVRIRIGNEPALGPTFWPAGDGELIVEYFGAQAVCGDPAAGDCFEERSAPFCEDLVCCNFVCAFDPTCCAESWDRMCAATAALLCGERPTNDDCTSPRAAEVGVNAFRNNGAEGSTPTPCGALRFDVWYTYESPSDEPVTISFCEADGGWALISSGDYGPLDTRIAVFEFCGGQLVACSEDDCGEPTVGAKVTFTPQGGTTYLIGIGSNPIEESIYGQGVGAFVLSQGGSCPADLNSDGMVGAQDLAALLAAWGGPAGDLNDDGTTSSQDLAVLLGAWGACAP